MGFLNHSTNNIIIDAVLTEKGRELLSKNDNSFNITQFRLGDDEVDYSILEKYGLIIGKEKIEKNTPVFEAITDDNLALKYPIRTFVDNNTNRIFAFPYIVLDQENTLVQLTSNSEATQNIESTVRIKTFVNQDINFVLEESGLIDNSFTIKMFDKVLKLSNFTPEDIVNDIAYYTVNATESGTDFNGQQLLSFKLTARGRVTSSTYEYFASSSDQTLIKTQVEIIGNSTNSSLIIPVTITSNSTVSS